MMTRPFTLSEIDESAFAETPLELLEKALDRYNHSVIAAVKAETRLYRQHLDSTIPVYMALMNCIGQLLDVTLNNEFTPPSRINYPDFGFEITEEMLHGSAVDDKLSSMMAGLSVKTANVTSSVCDMWYDNLWEVTDSSNSILRRVGAGLKAVGLFVPTVVSKLHENSTDIEKDRNIHKLSTAIAYAQAAVDAVHAELERFREEAILHSNGTLSLLDTYCDLTDGKLGFMSTEEKKRLMTLCNTATLLKRCIERQVTY